VSAVYTQRRNSTQPEGRGVAFPESRLSVGSTRYRHPRRTRTVLQLDVVLDQCLEQRLHVRLIRKRLELSWLAFDREHCAMASAFFTRCRSRPLNSAMPSPLARRSNACARPPAMKHSHIFAPMRRRFHLYCTRAAVVVEGATVRSLSHGEHRHDHRRIRSQPFRRRLPLLLLFTLAVYATPFFAGVTAALAAFNHGAGVIGALVVGLIASVVTLVASQAAFAVVKSPAVRGAIALLIAAPAAVAGFHATLGLAQIGVSSEIWRHLSAVVGGVIVGFTAFVRLARTASLTSHERSIVLISPQPPSPPLAPSTTGD
jgi:hypothetical protein